MASSASVVGVTDEGHRHSAERGVRLAPRTVYKGLISQPRLLIEMPDQGDSVSYDGDGIAEQGHGNHAICSQSIKGSGSEP